MEIGERADMVAVAMRQRRAPFAQGMTLDELNFGGQFVVWASRMIVTARRGPPCLIHRARNAFLLFDSPDGFDRLEELLASLERDLGRPLMIAGEDWRTITHDEACLLTLVSALQGFAQDATSSSGSYAPFAHLSDATKNVAYRFAVAFTAVRLLVLPPTMTPAAEQCGVATLH